MCNMSYSYHVSYVTANISPVSTSGQAVQLEKVSRVQVSQERRGAPSSGSAGWLYEYVKYLSCTGFLLAAIDHMVLGLPVAGDGGDRQERSTWPRGGTDRQ